MKELKIKKKKIFIEKIKKIKERNLLLNKIIKPYEILLKKIIT